MALAAQFEKAETSPVLQTSQRPFYSIPELAERWRCSRASVYNRLRGEKVVDFAASGKKGHKLVPLDVVLKIEREHLRVLR
jgi:biotin operon repressor